MPPNKEIESTKAAVVVLLIMIVIGYLIWSIVLFFLEKSISIQTFASFGSSISGLFAGAAAYLVFKTLKVQKKEFEETRLELQIDREQQHKKAVEESFYSQLSLVSQSRNSLRLKDR